MPHLSDDVATDRCDFTFQIETGREVRLTVSAKGQGFALFQVPIILNVLDVMSASINNLSNENLSPWFYDHNSNPTEQCCVSKRLHDITDKS